MKNLPVILCLTVLSITGCNRETDWTSHSVVKTADNQTTKAEETSAVNITTEEQPVVYEDQRTPEEKARIAAEAERMRAASVEREKQLQQYKQQYSTNYSDNTGEQFYNSNEVKDVCFEITGITRGYAMLVAANFRTSVNSIQFLKPVIYFNTCQVIVDTPTGPHRCHVVSAVGNGNTFRAHVHPQQISAVCDL